MYMKHNIFRLVAVLVLLVSFNIAPAKVFLISVGVSDYPGTENDLNCADKDAKLITWLYKKNAGVTYKQILNRKATVDNILENMRNMFVKANKNDIIVFFFSGHGYPGGFMAYDGELEYDEVRKAMNLSQSNNKMIFADACYSGDIRSNRENKNSAFSRSKDANIMLFLSSRSNEVSWENSEINNSYFTEYLQKGLRGSADTNRDRTITAKELFKYVHKNVVKVTDDEQHPVMWGNFPDNMPVLIW